LAEKIAVPIGVMVGDEEIASKTVRVKILGSMEKSDGDIVKRDEMVDWIKGLLQKVQD
jgi:histidyl-tRNA synthetase